jgi:hypothetical protein
MPLPVFVKCPHRPSQIALPVRIERRLKARAGNSLGPRRQDDTVIALLYLRSNEGQQILRSLQTGATVAQLNPGVLLEDVRLPLPPAEQRAELLRRYRDLRAADEEIASLTDRKTQVVCSLWTLN